MEAPSDQELLIIAKGKRTKRQRPISPFRLAITDSPSSGDDDISTTTSSDDQFCVHTKEEEKIANYLIMLSKGHFFKEEENIYQVEEDHNVNVVNVNNDNNINNNNNNIPKFNSKRYMETTTGSGKAGFYVYECKTCNRTFPSFQALGGHRASHKKPKNMANQQEKKMNFGFSVSSDEDYESPRATTTTNNNSKINNMNTVSSLSLQLSTSKTFYGNITKPASKVHECSVCGAEFTSGQALGGHMRRHRGSVIGSNSALLYHQMPSESEDTDRNTMNNNNNDNNNNGVSLELDLNLPAPENDGVEDNKFQFIKSNNTKDMQNQGNTLKKDQGHENGEEDEEGRPKKRSKSSHDSSSSPLVFSVPALVDCHY